MRHIPKNVKSDCQRFSRFGSFFNETCSIWEDRNWKCLALPWFYNKANSRQPWSL